MMSSEYKPGMQVRVLPISKWKSQNARYHLMKHGIYFGITKKTYEEMENHIYTIGTRATTRIGYIYLQEIDLFIPICAVQLVGENFNKLLIYRRMRYED